MGCATSTIRRSAPWPSRSAASACSTELACATLTPLSSAILVAAPIWPLSCPTMRRRMGSSLSPLGFDDFGHGDAEAILDEDDFAAGDETVVDVNIDGFADLAVELDDHAAAEFQQLRHFHGRLAEHGRDVDRHV